MKTPISWTCPHCNTVNVTLHDTEVVRERNIEYCDCEIGGCDEMFVVETKREIKTVAVFSLKVEYPK